MPFTTWIKSVKSTVRSSRQHRSRGRRRPSSRGVRLCLELLEDRSVPTLVSWTGNAGNFDWDTAGNWSTGTVPGSGDDVQINALNPGASVAHSTSAPDAVNSLTSEAPIVLSGGSLTIAAGSTINNSLSISDSILTVGGTMAVTGPVSLYYATLTGNSRGSLTAQGGISEGSIPNNDFLDGITLINAAGQTANLKGNLHFLNGAALYNYGTAINDAGSYHATFYGDANAAFCNYGHFIESGSGLDITIPFFNSYTGSAYTGRVDLQYGELNLLGSVTGNDHSQITGATGTTLGLGGPLSFPATSSISADTVTFRGGSTVAVAAAYSANSTIVRDAGTVALTGAVSSLGAVGVHWASRLSGTLDLTRATLASGATTLASLDLEHAALLGAYDFTVTGPVNLYYGTLSAGGGHGSLTAQGGISEGSIPNNDFLDGITLINAAGQTANLKGNLHFLNGAALYNYGTAINDAGSYHATFYGDANAAFCNYGHFIESGSGLDITIPFFNSYTGSAYTGRVDLQYGELNLLGSVTGNDHSQITGATGTTLGLGGPLSFPATSSISADTVTFRGGSTVAVAAAYSANSTIVRDAGTVALTGAVSSLGAVGVHWASRLSGTLDLTRATLASGATTLASLDLEHAALLGAYDFTVTGPVNLYYGTLSAGGGHGSLTAQGGISEGSIPNNDFLDGITLINAAGQTANLKGNLHFLNGAALYNYGTAINDAGSYHATFYGDANAAFYNYGHFIESGSGLDITIPFFNSYTGTVDVQSGSYLGLLSDGNSSGSYTGETGSTLDFRGNQTFLSSAIVNADALNLGGSLTLQIDRDTNGPRFPQIAGQSLTLSAELILSPTNGAFTNSGETFTLLQNTGTGPINGTFTGLSEGAIFVETGNVYQMTYKGGTGNDVVLTFMAPLTSFAASPLVVTNTSDAGFGSLRTAITLVNADPNHTLFPSPTNPGVDEIDFHITATSDNGGGYDPVTGIAAIKPSSALPTISTPVLIDGFTQPGSHPNSHAWPGPNPSDNAVRNIEVDGSSALNLDNGDLPASLFVLRGGGSTVRGLKIVTPSIGISLWNGGRDVISGNDITTTSPVVDIGGVAIDGGSFDTIGGANAEDRNIIAAPIAVTMYDGPGPTTNITVQGNFIGITATGDVVAPTAVGGAGIYLVLGDVVNGPITIKDNVISGNDFGVFDQVGVQQVTEAGNYFGTDATGTKAVRAAINAIEQGSPTVEDNIFAPCLSTTLDLWGGSQVLNNRIGVNVNRDPFPNSIGGGGVSAGASSLVDGNTIAFNNGFGVGAGSGTVIDGNTIHNIAGTGVVIGSGSTGVHIGQNSIYDNSGPGVWVQGNASSGYSTGVQISQNAIYNNSTSDSTISGGIVLGDDGNGHPVPQYASSPGGPHVGVNHLQNYPVLTAATISSNGLTISGTVNSVPGTTFRLEFFANAAPDSSGYGQGQTFLGAAQIKTDANGNPASSPDGSAVITTDGNGNVYFTVSLTNALPTGQGYLSATATNLTTLETSEFAPDMVQSLTVVGTTGPDTLTITGGAQAGDVQTNLNGVVHPFRLTGSVLLDGRGGSDTYTVNFGSTLTTPITIAGGGTDTLTVNGSTDPNTANNISKNITGENKITWGPSQTQVLETVRYSGINATNIHGGAGSNFIQDPGSQTTIFGGPSQNTVVITATLGNGVVIHGGGSDTYVIDLGSLAGPVTIDNSTSGAADKLIVNGAAGNNTIAVTSSQVTAGAQTVSYTAPITNLTVNGGSGNNQVTVTSLSASVASLTVNGGPANDTLAVAATVTVPTTLTAGSGGNDTLQGGGGSNTLVGSTGGGTTTYIASAGTTSIQAGTGDNVLVTAGGTVASVTAAAGNTAPAVFDDRYSLVVGSVFNVTATAGVLANDLSANGKALTAVLATGPAHGTLTLNADGSFRYTPVAGFVGSDSFTYQAKGSDGTPSSTATVKLQVNPDTTSTALTSSMNPASFGQALTLTAAVSANAPGSGTPKGTVDFFDTTTGIDLGSVNLSGGSANLSTNALPLGSQKITVTYGGDANFLPSSATLSENIVAAIYVLDPKASGALSLSGDSSINVPGLVQVDSKSATALTASGDTNLTAAAINVLGGYKKKGDASFSVPPTTGVSAPDPLAGLKAPSTTGLTKYGSVNLTKGSLTINPGIYNGIKVSGKGSLTLNPGIYILQGGGLTVTGSASLSGAGVLIYNAGSTAGDDPQFGGITLGGKGTFSLSAATTGPYAGVVVYQARNNTRALDLDGHASAGLSGVVYAPNALLTMSGHTKLQGTVVVGTLNLSGDTSLTQMAAGSDGSGDVASIADTLVAGDVQVYVDNSSGYLTADELARIQDTIDGLDSLLAPYSVRLSAVSDPADANLILDAGTTSACGTAADGVLGCYNGGAREITLLQGWDWYAGADPSQIGLGQYDFQTTVTHELGHALGLGGGSDPNSPMYETLSAGVSHRTMTVPDLNIPEPPVGADPLTASGFTEEEGRGASRRAALGQERPGQAGVLSAASGITFLGNAVASAAPGGLAGRIATDIGSSLVPNSATVFAAARGAVVDESASVPRMPAAVFLAASGKLGFDAVSGTSAAGAGAWADPTTQQTAMAASASAESARGAPEGSMSEDLSHGDPSYRALVDQVMSQLGADDTGSAPAVNLGEALLAVVGLEWLSLAERGESVAEQARRKAVRAGASAGSTAPK